MFVYSVVLIFCSPLLVFCLPLLGNQNIILDNDMDDPEGMGLGVRNWGADSHREYRGLASSDLFDFT